MLPQFSADYWQLALEPAPLIEPLALIKPRALIKPSNLIEPSGLIEAERLIEPCDAPLAPSWMWPEAPLVIELRAVAADGRWRRGVGNSPSTPLTTFSRREP